MCDWWGGWRSCVELEETFVGMGGGDGKGV